MEPDRRDIASPAMLDDHLLADMGFSRDQLADAFPRGRLPMVRDCQAR